MKIHKMYSSVQLLWFLSGRKRKEIFGISQVVSGNKTRMFTTAFIKASRWTLFKPVT